MHVLIYRSYLPILRCLPQPAAGCAGLGDRRGAQRSFQRRKDATGECNLHTYLHLDRYIIER